MDQPKLFEIIDGAIYLNREPVACAKSFSLVSSEVLNGIAELTITMDVTLGAVESTKK